MTARDLLRLGYAFIDPFIASYDAPPEVIVLDMDPTADHAHGHHTKPEVMRWLKTNAVAFITGLSPNNKLKERHAPAWQTKRGDPK